MEVLRKQHALPSNLTSWDDVKGSPVHFPPSIRTLPPNTTDGDVEISFYKTKVQ